MNEILYANDLKDIHLFTVFSNRFVEIKLFPVISIVGNIVIITQQN